MLEVRGGVGDGVGEERRGERTNLRCFTFKRRPPDRFQLTTRPCSLLFSVRLEAVSEHFQIHVESVKNPLFHSVANYEAKILIADFFSTQTEVAPLRKALEAHLKSRLGIHTGPVPCGEKADRSLSAQERLRSVTEPLLSAARQSAAALSPGLFPSALHLRLGR